jgi:glycosyltransferase involved in cell wall biosynthesis
MAWKEARRGVKVGIDARKLNELGIGSYIRGLLGGLSRQRLDEEYVVLVPPTYREEVPESLEAYQLDLANHTITEIFRLGRLIEDLGIDVFHSPYVSLPHTKRPCVVNLHDAITQQFPSRNFFAAWYFAYMNRRAARHATRVITGTHAAKADIESVVGCKGEKIVVVPDAVDEIFFRRDIEPPANRNQYFLYVGGDGTHKNVAGLLRAFALVREHDPSFSLVLTGGRFARHGEHPNVTPTGFVTREELVSLYRGATAVVVPSWVEGFGLPVLEGMAAGTPVLTSMAAAVLEVSGDAALHADALSPRVFADAMLRIAADEPLRRRLIAAGEERARVFTWDECAYRTRQVYKEVASGRR